MEWYLYLLITISHSKGAIDSDHFAVNITHNYVSCLSKYWRLTCKMFMNDLFCYHTAIVFRARGDFDLEYLVY